MTKNRNFRKNIFEYTAVWSKSDFEKNRFLTQILFFWENKFIKVVKNLFSKLNFLPKNEICAKITGFSV